MTDAYVNAKILEALEATGGDKHDAQKLLITWAIRDQQLLLGFAKPHLKELIAARIGESFKKMRRQSKQGEKSLFASEIDFLMERKTGGEKRSHPKGFPSRKTSLRQASVMQHIAAAFKKKT